MPDEYVRKDVFEAHTQRLEQRMNSLEKRMDERFDTLQALMGKTVIEMKAANDKLRSEMRENLTQINGDIKNLSDRMKHGFELLDERIDKNLAQYEAITRKIEGDVNTLNARVDSVQHRRGLDIAWTGIAVGAVVGLIQMFTK